MVLVAAGLVGLLIGLLLIAVSTEAEAAVPWALYLMGGLVAGLLLATVVSARLLLTLRPPSLSRVSGTTHELQTYPRRIPQPGSCHSLLSLDIFPFFFVDLLSSVADPE